MKDTVCDYCHKKFISLSYMLLHKSDLDFCSKLCVEMFEKFPEPNHNFMEELQKL